MTWRTQIGERTLQGAEATLIREALAMMVDMVEQEISDHDDLWEFGVPLFDRLPAPAKLALLAQVGWALLRATDVCPPLTAINEATIGALFRHIEQSIHLELDDADDSDQRFSWPKDVLTVFEQIGETDDLPALECQDLSEWEILVQVLTDRILWDEDFNDAELYVDKSPEHASILKSMMTIDDEYFTAVSPDPRESDLPRVRAVIQQLLHE
jgi:hypothetical protein